MFCRSLFVFMFFFCWPLYYLSVNLRLLISLWYLLQTYLCFDISMIISLSRAVKFICILYIKSTSGFQRRSCSSIVSFLCSILWTEQQYVLLSFYTLKNVLFILQLTASDTPLVFSNFSNYIHKYGLSCFHPL